MTLPNKGASSLKKSEKGRVETPGLFHVHVRCVENLQQITMRSNCGEEPPHSCHVKDAMRMHEAGAFC